MASQSRSQAGSGCSRLAKEEVLLPGTTLLTCEPFVYAGYRASDLTYAFCDSCLMVDAKLSGLFRCKSCRMVLYCNRKCQKKGWKDGHKYECEGMTQCSEFIENVARECLWEARILLRTFLKLQDGTDHFDELEIGGTNVKRRFADLMSHSEELQQNKERMDWFEPTKFILKLLLQPKPKPEWPEIKIPKDPELLEIYGKITTNAFEILDGYYAVGSGVYLGTSIFNHSCQPMAEHVFDGTTMYVRNIMEIPKSLPIDQVTVYYVDLLMPSSERRRALQKGYHFHCECERCTTGQHDKEMRSIICSNKKCRAKVDSEELKDPCKACGNILKKETISDILEAKDNAVELVDPRKRIMDLPLIEACIQRVKALNFSDSHWVMLKLFKHAFYATAAMNPSTGEPVDLKKAFQYASKYFKIARLYLHPNVKELLRCSHELAYTARRLKKVDEAQMYLSIAKSIAEVLFGKNSSFWRKFLVPVENGINELIILREMNQLVVA